MIKYAHISAEKTNFNENLQKGKTPGAEQFKAVLC